MGLKLIGTATEEKIGHPLDYYRQRDISLDCRGDLQIHPGCHLAQDVKIITAGHNPDPRKQMDVRYRPVHIGNKAFIYNHAILYNCLIGEGAIVRPGTVVASRIVRPWTIVEGNPAVEIAEYDHKQDKWNYYYLPHDLEWMGPRRGT